MFVRRNDKAPVFDEPSYEFNIDESLGSGSLVGRIIAVDPDTEFNKVSYEIFSGDSASTYFSINPSTGQISLRRSVRDDFSLSYKVTFFEFEESI